MYLDPEVEILARKLYEINPDRRAYDGSVISFSEANQSYASFPNHSICLKQATALLEMMKAPGGRKKSA